MFRWQLQGYVALGLPHPLLQAQHLQGVGKITAPNCDGSPRGPRELCSTQSSSAAFVLCLGRGGAGASLGGPGHQTEMPSRDRDRDWSFPDSHFRKAPFDVGCVCGAGRQIWYWVERSCRRRKRTPQGQRQKPVSTSESSTPGCWRGASPGVG